MNFFRWITFGAILFFIFSVVAPCDAVSASKARSKSKVEKSIKTKKSVSVKKTVKKAASSAEDNEREIWRKRAMGGSASSVGMASWYGKDFHKKPTASGVDYDMYTFTAAHRTLPIGTVVKVTDASNGKSVMVCVTDRGPYVNGRIIDLSYAAAERLDLMDRGVGKVKLEVVSDEKGVPLNSAQAYYVRYAAGNGDKTVGPFAGFEDAASMREALEKAHPEAEVILDKSR